MDGDGVCDDAETLGCDDLAVNYDENTENDGSCNYNGLEAPDGFGFMTGPAAATILGTVTLDGAAGSGLDWIGAFTNTGQCVGATNPPCLTVCPSRFTATIRRPPRSSRD